MDEIGHILREARENKGLSLEEAQGKTRINVRYLTALENGQYSALPTPVHVRGFLRNYARFLGLDPQPLLTRYAAGQGQDAPPPMAETREITPDNPLVERQDQPFFDPVNMEVNGKSGYGVGSGGSGGMLQIVIIVALVIALALIANRFIPILFGRGEEGNAVEEVSAAVRDMVAEVTGATPTPSTTPTPAPTGESSITVNGTEQPIVNTGRNNPGGAATPTATRLPLPATMEEVRLKLDVLERTWMEVTVDSSVVFSGIAKANDTFEWTAQQEAKIVVGNAIGVFATVNDVALGRLGGRGESHEEVWRTTQATQ